MRMNLMRKGRGFTLIEMMIVVAVIGILASIAYPSYQDHIVKTFRGNAKACVSEYAQFMERHYTANMSYDIEDAAVPQLSCRTEGGLNTRYAITVDNRAQSTYTITATPLGVQLARDMKCGTLTLTHQGVRGAAGSGCW